MSQYLRYAVRSLAREPGLALATVLTLTLGLGLNVGVFTVVDGIMFRARVERDPGSFVHLSPEYRYDHPTRGTAWAISVHDYRAFMAGTGTLSIPHRKPYLLETYVMQALAAMGEIE